MVCYVAKAKQSNDLLSTLDSRLSLLTMAGKGSNQKSGCPIFEIYHKRLLGIEPILNKLKKLAALFTWLIFLQPTCGFDLRFRFFFMSY